MLKYVFIFLVLIPVLLAGQDFAQMNQLYQQKKMAELEQLVSKSSDEKPETLFFKTVFNENGEESVKVYESLFPEVSGELKSLVSGKISEYYYAKGFYVKASEYARYVKSSTETPVSPEPSKNVVAVEQNKIYHIQVGAFGYRDNANRMKQLLKDKNINSDVKIRQVNGKTLYCVWVHGHKTYRETKMIADDLKNKYKLKYQIINP